jgi:hypothetical protein
MELNLSLALHLPSYIVASLLVVVAGITVSMLRKRLSAPPRALEAEVPKRIEGTRPVPNLPEDAPLKLARISWPEGNGTLN